MSSSKKSIKIFCGRCGRDTNHHILCERSEGSKKDDDYHWGIDHYFVQCAGCDNYCYALSRWDEDDWDPYSGEVTIHWDTYPVSKGQRPSIDDSDELPNKVNIIYREVIASINSNLHILSAIGLRTLIEAICKDRGVEGKNLEVLIDALARNGILSTDQAKILNRKLGTDHGFSCRARSATMTTVQENVVCPYFPSQISTRSCSVWACLRIRGIRDFLAPPTFWISV